MASRGEEHLSSSCRSLLAKFCVALPRQRRQDDGVPAGLSAHGVTAREPEVWELLGEARSTRRIRLPGFSNLNDHQAVIVDAFLNDELVSIASPKIDALLEQYDATEAVFSKMELWRYLLVP